MWSDRFQSGHLAGSIFCRELGTVELVNLIVETVEDAAVLVVGYLVD